MYTKVMTLCGSQGVEIVTHELSNVFSGMSIG